MKLKIAALSAALLLTLSGCAKAQTAWVTDYDEAKDAAAKGKKDLLVVFTGSDWNDPSKELITSVFTEEFFARGTKDYVLCNVDIVQDQELMSAEQSEKNYKVASDFGVQALPYLVLLTSEGDMYASAAPGDDAKTVEGFYAYLDTFGEAKTKLSGLKKLIASSKGTERAKNIDTFVEAVDPSQRQRYSEMIREIPGLDPDNAEGLKEKYLLQIAYLDAVDLYQQGKLVEAGDCFLTLADGGQLNPAHAQEAYYMGAYMNAMSGQTDNDKVIAWLEKAIAADPENPGSEQIRGTIEQIKAQAVTIPSPEAAE